MFNDNACRKMNKVQLFESGMVDFNVDLLRRNQPNTMQNRSR